MKTLKQQQIDSLVTGNLALIERHDGCAPQHDGYIDFMYALATEAKRRADVAASSIKPDCEDCGETEFDLVHTATGYKGLGMGERWLCAECAAHHSPMKAKELHALVADVRFVRDILGYHRWTVDMDGMAGSIAWNISSTESAVDEDEPTLYITPDWESSEPTVAISIEHDGQYIDGDTVDWPSDSRTAESYFAIVKPWLDKLDAKRMQLAADNALSLNPAARQLIPVVR